MIVSIFSWTIALIAGALPPSQRAIALWPLAFATGLLLVLALWITYQPPSGIAINYDRVVYESAFLDLQSSDFSSGYEPGYVVIQRAAIFVGLNSAAFLALIGAFFLFSLWTLLRQRYQLTEAVLLLFLSINFFPFMQGALNVTRQFVATSVLLFAFPFFARTVETNFKNYQSLVGLLLIVLAASMFHQSAALCLFPIALMWLGLRTLHLALLAAALFTANLTGLGPTLWGPLVAESSKLSEYIWSFDRGDVGIIYSGGVNRIDFFVFSMLPVLVHSTLKWFSKDTNPNQDSMILFYVCLVYPLFALSFLPYSDRLAFYGWLIWPIALCDLALRSEGQLSLGVLILATVGFGAVALFGLYGLTVTQFAFEMLF